ncbi:hypothetical protein [Priestia megaterium]|uniref:hypothetical protein n=1 Tax=Priestia megaterium TaxID=1404 RepID=UPI001BE5BF1B|nr:hypothetical protein [Priestia megaterium]MBT2253994.1 hypothetical protein [Priestia megaterium]MBT2279247.1 hypothetical protein [Priestia megaterium]
MKRPHCGLLTDSKVIDSCSYLRTVKCTGVCSKCNYKWGTPEVTEHKYTKS